MAEYWYAVQVSDTTMMRNAPMPAYKKYLPLCLTKRVKNHSKSNSENAVKDTGREPGIARRGVIMNDNQ